MVSKVGKDLLRNTIRSTDFYNRVQEEQNMWRQWDSIKHTGSSDNSTGSHNIRKRRSRHFESSDKPEEKGLQNFNKSSKNLPFSNIFTKKLMELEESDSQRWGHSGYKELYPEEFTDVSACNVAYKLLKRKLKKKIKHESSKNLRKKCKTKKKKSSKSDSDSHRKHKKKKKRKEE